MREVRRTGAALLAAFNLCTGASAQAVPSLGSEALIGTAGVTALSPWGTSGAAGNPSSTGCCARWSLGLALLTAPSTDVTERSFAGTIRTGRLGFGLRLASREVAELFDDPVLEDADLRVEDTDVALTAALGLGRGVRLGVTGLYNNSTVLGATAEGFGGRLGAEYTRQWWSLGASYGALQTRAKWRVGGEGSGEVSPGVRRLAIAGSINTARFSRVLPRVTIEADSDEGERSERWLRASLGWKLLDDQVQMLGGLATEMSGRSVPSTYETAVGLHITGFLVYIGARLAPEPAPGNTYAIGLVFQHQ
jgi:hypothetical protein